MRRAMRGLARLTGRVHRLATSPADRALGTAELLGSALLPHPKLETWPELAPGNEPGPLFDRIARTGRPSEELVLVGHNPTLSEFVGMALVGEPSVFVLLGRGGAAGLEFPLALRPGGGRLVWLATRGQLAGGRR